MGKALDFIASFPDILFSWQGLWLVFGVFGVIFALLLLFGILHWPGEKKLTPAIFRNCAATAMILSAMTVATVLMSFCLTCLMAAIFGCVIALFTNDAQFCVRAGMLCGMSAWFVIPALVVICAEIVNRDLKETPVE